MNLLKFLRLPKRPPVKSPPPESYVDLFWDAATGRLIAQNPDGTSSPVNKELPGNVENLVDEKAVTEDDHGKTFVPTDETNNLVILPSNPKAIRFTVYVAASGDTPVEFECAQEFYFLSGDVTGGNSDGTDSLPPGTYPFVVEAIGGKWFITSAI